MTGSGFDVVVVGNVGIDTNVFFHSDVVDFSVEANFTQNFDMIGQAGGYASRGYARLNVTTAFAGCVGADFTGDHIRRVFSSEDINTDGIFYDPQGTSRSINFMYANGQRKNFYDGKSHMVLHPPIEVLQGIFAGAKLAHFNIPNWAREVLPIARQNGVKIACDLQDVLYASDPYRLDFIQASDFLFFSAANHGDPSALINEYLCMNSGLTIISGMGANGCALGLKEGIRYFPAVEMDLPVVDTNGAGDALAVGFLTSYVLDGFSLERSIRRAQISARYKCAQKATSSCMITRELLDHYDLDQP